MKIAIDLRSLSSGNVSGVENYTLSLLERLLAMDKQNQYTLFYNSFFSSRLGELIKNLNFINSQREFTRWPNKFLNLCFKFGTIKLENLIGEFDCFFMPNLNQFNVGPGAKLAITVHDLSPLITPQFYNIKRRIWHNFLEYKQAFVRANIIFAISEFTKYSLEKFYNVDPCKISVIYPGVDHSVFHPDLPEETLRNIRNIYDLPGDYILFLNTIEPRKNLNNLILAFEQIPGKTHLVIAGRKGWKYRRLFTAIKKSKKSKKIRYLGYIYEKDKPGLIKLAKALVYPSYYEGFGFQPLEAMALGVPVVTSSLTSLPEVVGDAVLMVDPYNPGKITKALIEVTTNKHLRQTLIQKGLEKSAEFSWQKCASKILMEINKL